MGSLCNIAAKVQSFTWCAMHFGRQLVTWLAVGLAPVVSLASEPLPRAALIDDRLAQNKPGPIAISGAANRAPAETKNPSPAPAKEQPRRILMLYPFSDTFPSSVSVGNAARRHFSKRLPGHVDIFSYYLDLARFPGAEHEERTARFLAQKYADVPPDLVIAAGPAALRFALNYRSIIAPNVRLIYCSIAVRTLASLEPPHDVAGIASQYDLAKTFELAKRLQPNARHVVVIAGTADGDRRWEANARQQLAGRTDGFDTRYLIGLSREEILSEVSRLAPETIVLLLTVFRDGVGQLFSPRDIAEELSKASTAPVYAAYESILGHGTVGGYMDTNESVGIAAAELGLGIFAGGDPGEIASRLSTPHAYRVDARQLARWGLAEARLPPDTVVQFKKATLWEQYRWQVIAVFAALLLQATLISGLLVERHRRRVAELESRRRLVELAHMNRTAAASVMSASIAHELNQPLGAILSNTEAVELLLAANPLNLTQIKEILADIRKADQRAGEIIGSLRAFLKRKEIERREVELSEVIGNVVHLLDAEAKERKVEMTADRVQPALFVRADLVHLQQVLLNLALNGMDAVLDCVPGRRRITFETALVGKSTVEVSVADTGTGIPSDRLKSVFEPFFTTKPHGTGLGLSIVRTIVETYGGRIWAENRHEGGATFRFTLPLGRA
jgi:signal transduction histidine kinase